MQMSAAPTSSRGKDRLRVALWHLAMRGLPGLKGRRGGSPRARFALTSVSRSAACTCQHSKPARCGGIWRPRWDLLLDCLIGCSSSFSTTHLACQPFEALSSSLHVRRLSDLARTGRRRFSWGVAAMPLTCALCFYLVHGCTCLWRGVLPPGGSDDLRSQCFRNAQPPISWLRRPTRSASGHIHGLVGGCAPPRLARSFPPSMRRPGGASPRARLLERERERDVPCRCAPPSSRYSQSQPHAFQDRGPTSAVSR